MKRKRVIGIVSVLAFVVVAGVAWGVNASTGVENKPYDFPIVPGDEEWTELETKQGILEVCQIPEDRLENMTTEALLETVLHYPLIESFTAFNSVEDACNAMKEDFNGFRELFSRDDVTKVLEQKYLEAQKRTEEETEEISLLETVEYLLACNEI